MMTRANTITRRAALGLIGAAFTLPRAGLASDLDTLGGNAFGTGWRIAGRDTPTRLGPAIEVLFARIDAQFSPWRRDSGISRINAAPAGAQAVEPEIAQVTAAALDIARQSEGAFDPTVGPLVAQWGFGPIGGTGAPGWRGIAIAPEGLTKARGDLTLDLCGIAKGWALDRAADLARAEGVTDMLLDLGGEFVALGTHPEGRDWRIAVESPLPAQPPTQALRLPPGMAVATSGVRTQSYVLNGRLYSHIIDPETRAPASGRLRSVTVAAGDAMTADAWATALFAAGDEGGPDLAATRDIAALFLFETDDGLRQHRNGAIRDLIL